MWPAYLINLPDNTARLANCAAQLEAQKIRFDVVQAVNGWNLTEAEIRAVYDEAANAAWAKAPLVRPELGCYLSHIKVWNQIANGKAAGGFIFEDDFMADGALAEIMRELSKDSTKLEMVKLFSLDQSPKMIAEKPLGKTHRLVTPYRVPISTIGYSLTKTAAARLISQRSKFFRPVDEDHKYFWETGLDVKLVLPSPITVGDQQSVTGTVGTERRRLKKKNLKAVIRGTIYRVRYTTRLHYYRHKKAK